MPQKSRMERKGLHSAPVGGETPLCIFLIPQSKYSYCVRVACLPVTWIHSPNNKAMLLSAPNIMLN